MRLYSLYNIIFSFVILNKIEIGRAAHFSKFKVLDIDTNRLCLDYHIEWELSAPSAVACAMRCSTTSPCLGTVYKVDGSVCYGLHSGHEAAPCAPKTSGGVVFWKLPGTCPSGWESISRWCYKITANMVWQTALELCMSYSEVSHLAYVRSKEEHLAIMTWFMSMGKDDRTWLGGYRIDNTNNWTWVDGVEITDDFNWGGGEPDNEYPTDCLLFFSNRVDFGDRDCTLNYTGLCELDIYN